VHGIPLTFETLEFYLHQLIAQQHVRLYTFNRRLTGREVLIVYEHGFQFISAHEASVKLLCSLYDQEAYMRLNPVRWKRAGKNKVMYCHYNTDKKIDICKHAICLVNLIMANPPLEMVRLKVHGFDLANRTVQVMTVKQGEMKEKRLTQECVQAIQNIEKTAYTKGGILHSNSVSA